MAEGVGSVADIITAHKSESGSKLYDTTIASTGSVILILTLTEQQKVIDIFTL